MILQNIANYGTIISTIVSVIILIITFMTIKKVNEININISNNNFKTKQDNRWNNNKNAWNDFTDKS